ncbi:outer membrane beta-barrel protein [Halovulum sp. GXIMD14794]
MRKAALAIALCGLAAPASAQDDWEFTFSLYGWFTGINSELETPRGTVNSNISFSDVWDSLDIALFTAAEARRGRWSGVVDVIYSELTSFSSTGFPTYSEAKVSSDMAVIGGFATYRAIEQPNVSVDVLGGFRYYNVDIGLGLRGDGAPDLDTSRGDQWVDPVIGARVRAPIGDSWFVNGFADIGGFGIGDASDLSWQIYGGAGYEINETWVLQGGYRYLSIDREFDNADTKLELYGLLLGVSARF